MITSDLLFLGQLAVFGVCEWVGRSKVTKPQLTPVTEPQPVVTQPAESTQLDPTLHPVFKEWWETKQEARRLDAPSSFVEFAKTQRKANMLEKKWKSVFETLSPEEQTRHTAVGDRRPPPPEPQEDLSSPANLTRVMETVLRQMGQTPKPVGTAVTMMPIVRLILSWLAVHLIAGWSASVRGVPLISFPSLMFGSLGAPRFPLNIFMSQVPEEAVFQHSLSLADVGSETNFFSAPPVCRAYVTVSFFFVMMVLSTVFTHIKHELSKLLNAIAK